MIKSLTPFVSRCADAGESGAVTSIVGWEEGGSGGAVYPLDLALGCGVLVCGVGGRALIFRMSLVVGVVGEEVVG